MNGIIKTFLVVSHHPTETTHYFFWKSPLYHQCVNPLSQIFLHHWTRPLNPWPAVIPIGVPLSFRSEACWVLFCNTLIAR